ncbi:TIGR04222 domain-containing membrane protein [Spirillospora sp. NPDC052269]
MSAALAAGGAMDLYETAYLCGGGDRVALVALLRATQDGHIRIAPARHRVTAVLPGPEDAALDPVTAEALASLPSTGAMLGEVRRMVAGSDAVADVRRELVGQGLLWGRFHTPRGRRRRAELAPDAPLEWVAMLGASAIADERLQKIFAAPDPDLSGARRLRRHPLIRRHPQHSDYSPLDISKDGIGGTFDGGGHYDGGGGGGGGGW